MKSALSDRFSRAQNAIWLRSLRRGGGLGLLVGLAVVTTPLQAMFLPSARYSGPPLPPSSLTVPPQRTLAWSQESVLARHIFASYAARSLGNFAKSGKGGGGRILLARLLARQQLAETNQYILAAQPWGVTGTSGWQNPKGDYDFESSVLTTILWLFGEDSATLTPAAREHLLHVLLTEEGGDYRAAAPNTGGLIEETENHLLMTEGSRYLKNRWLQRHGNAAPLYNNVANGLEDKLLTLLAAIRTAGFHEFNSQPYIGYTILGLLNLEAFASDHVRASARQVLDAMNFNYALGSYRLRHFPPFRRRIEYAGMTSLTAGYHTAYMTAWLSYAEQPLVLPELPGAGVTHALIGAALPYRPPDAVVRLLFDKGPGYFVKIGHGEKGSPEIYSAGPGFLLSAGGVHRGKLSVIVARPITLQLDDNVTELAEVFHLAGPGTDFRAWNNTGVQENFACAAGPVHIPARFKAVQSNKVWRIYAGGPGLLLAVHSTPALGLLAVFPGADPVALLAALGRANPTAEALAHEFIFPHGQKLTYDLASNPDQWVMLTAAGQKLDRNFDQWPLLDGRL